MYMLPRPVDITKMYRASWWEKRVDNGLSIEARHYAGCNGYGSIDGVYNRTNGINNTNPYFFSTGLIPSQNQLPVGEWVLVVGHVWPVNSGVGSSHQDSGIYAIQGNKITNSTTNFVFREETQTFRARTLLCYRSPSSDTTSGATHHTVYPRLDVCDGTEPSINDLLNNKTDKVYNLMSLDNTGVMLNGPIFGNMGLNFDGANDIVVGNYGNDYDLNSKELTVSAWVKTNILSGSRMFLAAGGSGQASANKRFYIGRVNNSWAIGLQNSIWDSSGPTATTDWTEITITCNPYTKTVKMYINGVDSGYFKNHTGFNLFGDFALGNYSNSSGDWWWNGAIGQVKFYERIINDDEIFHNYNIQKGRYVNP
jgi:hypothetical protein